jgi:hypothetical protein
MPPADANGVVALMLCESILHVLVEDGVITKEKARDAIETVSELTGEMADDVTSRKARTLIQQMARGFGSKGRPRPRHRRAP